MQIYGNQIKQELKKEIDNTLSNIKEKIEKTCTTYKKYYSTNKSKYQDQSNNLTMYNSLSESDMLEVLQQNQSNKQIITNFEQQNDQTTSTKSATSIIQQHIDTNCNIIGAICLMKLDIDKTLSPKQRRLLESFSSLIALALLKTVSTK